MEKNNKKMILSSLWTVLLINMIFADIYSIFIELNKFEKVSLPGDAETIMLVMAFVTNIPIMMIFFSIFLRYNLNRWFNICAGIFTIVYVWAGMSEYPHYIAVAAIVSIISFFIIGIAWNWKNTELKEP